jgi:hypothetical protein
MIIFHQLTWQQFLITALVLAAIWYAAVGILYFRDEAAGLFSGKRAVKTYASLKPDLEQAAEAEPGSLLGRSREPEGVSILAMSQFGFTGAGRGVENGESAEKDMREARLGLIPDLMEELKTIFYMLERESGTREDFVELFRPLAARFGSVITNPNYAAVNAYILDQVPFELSTAELEGMWEGSEV